MQSVFIHLLGIFLFSQVFSALVLILKISIHSPVYFWLDLLIHGVSTSLGLYYG